jgi:hypothetical protein
MVQANGKMKDRELLTLNEREIAACARKLVIDMCICYEEKF